jgi:[acyl-carrier-protein] S-malonyltransferase
MSKIAAIFPGQGAQKIGMGKDLKDDFLQVSQMHKKADEILAFKLSELIFNGPEDELRISSNTQPAIYLNSVSIFSLLKNNYKIDFQFTAGHSLGEYAALYASGVISFEDGLKLVRKRGELMSETSKNSEGTMAAIIGLTSDKINDIINEASMKGIIIAANFNSPEQIVISGEKTAVEYACDLSSEAGAKRAIILNVSNAFHSPLMKEASDEFAGFIDGFSFDNAKIPFFAAGNLELYTNGEEIKAYLKKQIMLPVRWVKAIEHLKMKGVNQYIEIGPGKTLCNLIRKIDKSLETNFINSTNTFNNFGNKE